jgi:hypothetical protein
MQTITAVEAVARAESDLKRILGDPTATGEQVRKAEDAVLAARRAAAEGVERASTRQRLQNELSTEATDREKARRRRLAAEAMDALAEAAPVVVLKYGNLTVTIKLAGGPDHVARQSARVGVQRAIEMLDREYADLVIATRNQVLAGVEPPPIGGGVPVRLYDLLTDVLRHTRKHGEVTVEVGAEEMQP